MKLLPQAEFVLTDANLNTLLNVKITSERLLKGFKFLFMCICESLGVPHTCVRMFVDMPHMYVCVSLGVPHMCMSPWVATHVCLHGCAARVCMCLRGCATHVYVSGSKVKLEMTVSHSTWVLGTDLGCSGNAAATEPSLPS